MSPTLLFLLAFVALFGGGGAKHAEPVPIDVGALRNGDLILQTTTSSQAPAIVLASASPYSHVGIIVVDQGRVSVVEASSKVQKTPIQVFLQRGVNGAYTVLRHRGVDEPLGLAISTQAKRHIGKPYDLSFARGDGALYCSELVAIAFRDAGLEVGAWEKAGDLHLDNPVVQALIAKRWKKHPVCRGAKTLEGCEQTLRNTEIITPGSLRADAQFDVVASTYPIGLK